MTVAANITLLRKKLETSQLPEPIIIFLTDGDPTVGICNREDIINETTRLNQVGKATIFTLGLGNDVDFEFLKKLALCNSGFCRRIYEASDTALQLTDFYREISSPLLSNITFIYQPEQVSYGKLILCIIMSNLHSVCLMRKLKVFTDWHYIAVYQIK